jgi:hypothetical protein
MSFLFARMPAAAQGIFNPSGDSLRTCEIQRMPRFLTSVFVNFLIFAPQKSSQGTLNRKADYGHLVQ